MREIVLDIETSGLSYSEGHKIIEIGCFELIDKEIGSFYHQYINPDKKLTQENTNIHGLTNEFLEPYPSFNEVCDEFLDFVKEDLIVAHNAQFDIGFLNNELEQSRKRLIPQNKIIDTLIIARDTFPGQQINLDSLVKKLKLNTMVERTHHGALKDAKILTDVYLELKGHTQIGFNLFNEAGEDEIDQIEPYQGKVVLTKDETELNKEFIKKINEQ